MYLWGSGYVLFSEGWNINCSPSENTCKDQCETYHLAVLLLFLLCQCSHLTEITVLIALERYQGVNLLSAVKFGQMLDLRGVRGGEVMDLEDAGVVFE